MFFIVNTTVHTHKFYPLRCVHGARKQACNCCTLLAVLPVKQVISRKLILISFGRMFAPSGTSTEGNGSASSEAAMAIPVKLPIADSPFTVDISTPPGSDKSRSLRQQRHLPPLGNAVVPSHAGFTHRGFVPQAPREGWPQTRPLNQINVHHYQQNVHIENLQVNFNEQNVHLHAHDPAVTSLVEATAKLRHQEVLTQAHAQAEALHKAKTEELMEALRVREGIESQRARDAIVSNENEMNRMGTRLKESFKHEAQEHVRLQEAQIEEKIHAYQMVIGANHRQSLSSKE